MIRAVIFAALIAVAMAGNDGFQYNYNPAPRARPTTREACTGDWIWVDYSAMYANVSGVQVAGCVVDNYEEGCATPEGFVACDTYEFECSEYSNANYDKTYWTATNKPSKCTQYGNSYYPDAKVLTIAEPLFAILSFIVAAVLVSLGVVRHAPVLVTVTNILIIVFASILSVSYYYLNAYVVVASALAATGLYCVRTPAAAGAGMLVAFFAFFWTTLEGALGYYQHQSRFTAGEAGADTYKSYCVEYYSGYFYAIQHKKDADTDPLGISWGFCSSEFLGAELFFMIFLQLLLILHIFSGVLSLTFVSSNEPQEEPVAEERAAATEEVTTH